MGDWGGEGTDDSGTTGIDCNFARFGDWGRGEVLAEAGRRGWSCARRKGSSSIEQGVVKPGFVILQHFLFGVQYSLD